MISGGDSPEPDALMVPPEPRWRDTILTTLVLLWACATAAFYFVRFTFVFFHFHQGAIKSLINRLGGI